MTEEIEDVIEDVIPEEPKFIYAIRISNLIDFDGVAHTEYIEVARLEDMGMPFDLTDPDAVYIMACMYAVDVLGYEDASMADNAEFFYERFEGHRVAED